MNEIPKIAMVLCIAAFCCSETHAVSNLSLNKKYSWSRLPGQSPGVGPHYRDDFSIHGLHDVHTAGVGVFDVGDLTDGAIQPAAGGVGGGGQPLVGQHGGAPQVDIIFDLEEIFRVSEIVVGTDVTAGANNNAPSSVSYSFSSTGSNPGDFGAATLVDLEGLFGPLADGHHDLSVAIPDNFGRFVKLTFGPGSFTEPNGSDPNEKWILDEVTINGNAIPEPTTATLGLIGLAGLVARRRRNAA